MFDFGKYTSIIVILICVLAIFLAIKLVKKMALFLVGALVMYFVLQGVSIPRIGVDENNYFVFEGRTTSISVPFRSVLIEKKELENGFEYSLFKTQPNKELVYSYIMKDKLLVIMTDFAFKKTKVNFEEIENND